MCYYVVASSIIFLKKNVFECIQDINFKTLNFKSNFKSYFVNFIRIFCKMIVICNNDRTRIRCIYI